MAMDVSPFPLTRYQQISITMQEALSSAADSSGSLYIQTAGQGLHVRDPTAESGPTSAAATEPPLHGLAPAAAAAEGQDVAGDNAAAEWDSQAGPAAVEAPRQPAMDATEVLRSRSASGRAPSTGAPPPEQAVPPRECQNQIVRVRASAPLLCRRGLHCAVADRAIAAGVNGSDPQPDSRQPLQASSGPQQETAQLAEEERRLSEQEAQVSGEEKAQVTSGPWAVCLRDLPSLTALQPAG